MGELSGVSPPKMDWNTPDLPTTFQAFKQYCNLIFAGPFSGKSDEEQITYILIWIGQEGLQMYNTWNLSADDAKIPEKIWENFEKHIEPKINFRLHRFNLQKYRQTAGESIDEYMTRCKLQAKKCKFKDEAETSERLIEQLIIGTTHTKVQEILLSKGEKLTLDNAMDIARAREATVSQMEQLTGELSKVHTFRKTNYMYKQSGNCNYCGGNHPPKPREKCPAYGTTCDACSKPNHWQSVCKAESKFGHRDRRPRSGSRQNYKRNAKARPRSASSKRPQYRQTSGKSPGPRRRREDMISVEHDFDALTFETVTIGSISSQSGKSFTRDEAFATVGIILPNKPDVPAVLKAKVDIGAQGNILPVRIFRKMFPERLDAHGYPKPDAIVRRKTILTAYNGSQIQQYGTVSISCTYGDKSEVAEFFVAESQGPAILGLPTLTKLQVVKLNCVVTQSQRQSPKQSPVNCKEDLVKQYPDRFQGIGNFKGKAHITVDKAVPPVVHPPRKCPIHLKDDIKREIDEMEQLGVITRVTEPTDWVSSLAYSRKSNGRIRNHAQICGSNCFFKTRCPTRILVYHPGWGIKHVDNIQQPVLKI